MPIISPQEADSGQGDPHGHVPPLYKLHDELGSSRAPEDPGNAMA